MATPGETPSLVDFAIITPDETGGDKFDIKLDKNKLKDYATRIRADKADTEYIVRSVEGAFSGLVQRLKQQKMLWSTNNLRSKINGLDRDAGYMERITTSEARAKKTEEQARNDLQRQSVVKAIASLPPKSEQVTAATNTPENRPRVAIGDRPVEINSKVLRDRQRALDDAGK